MKKYGVLLIGCGYIGEQHIQDIYYRENIKIVAVVDSIVEKAKMFSEKYNVDNYGTDYHEFLNNEKIDIVIIATYSKYHLPILKDCLQAGKNVLCEKPIATTMEEANEFYKLVKSSKNKVLVGHILRHNRTYQKVKELIENNTVGDIRVIRMTQSKHIKNKERYNALMQDCSPVVDCGVHYVDVIRWCTGLEITKIDGVATKVNKNLQGNFYDYGILTMQLSNGGMAYYEGAWAETAEYKNIKEFIGEKGRINIILNENRPQNREEGDLIELYETKDNKYTQINIDSKYKNMYGQISTLIDMIENGSEGSPSIEDAMKAFSIVLEYDKIIKNKMHL